MSENHTTPGPASALRGADGATVVALNGEIDLLSADELAERLDTLTAGPRPDLVLDLRPATFIDCAGLSVLCRTRNRALERRGRLRLVADDSTGFLRMLRLTGLGGVFEVHSRLP
ncbi:STAS domain-containing protein [Streptomyces sp. NPDC093248]|uniref:STAS domain-containing protein n=1 Tax=Streptomyces sp. NPDC093248 TaxID=3155072 RepID=UPI003420183C